MCQRPAEGRVSGAQGPVQPQADSRAKAPHGARDFPRDPPEDGTSARVRVLAKSLDLDILFRTTKNGLTETQHPKTTLIFADLTKLVKAKKIPLRLNNYPWGETPQSQGLGILVHKPLKRTLKSNGGLPWWRSG